MRPADRDDARVVHHLGQDHEVLGRLHDLQVVVVGARVHRRAGVKAHKTSVGEGPVLVIVGQRRAQVTARSARSSCGSGLSGTLPSGGSVTSDVRLSSVILLPRSCTRICCTTARRHQRVTGSRRSAGPSPGRTGRDSGVCFRPSRIAPSPRRSRPSCRRATGERWSGVMVAKLKVPSSDGLPSGVRGGFAGFPWAAPGSAQAPGPPATSTPLSPCECAYTTPSEVVPILARCTVAQSDSPMQGCSPW